MRGVNSIMTTQFRSLTTSIKKSFDDDWIGLVGFETNCIILPIYDQLISNQFINYKVPKEN